jgi:sensitive to high expression protein 9
MGMNFVLFVILQFIAEPWKRRRLVRGVVAEEMAVLQEVRGELEQVKLAIESQNQPAASAALASAVEATRELEAEPIVEAAASEEILPAEGLLSVEEAEPSEVPFASTVEQVAEAPLLHTLPTLPTRTWEEVLKDPEWWRAKAEDLYSERWIDMRMRDASLLVLEGALAGAVCAGSIVLLMVRRS